MSRTCSHPTGSSSPTQSAKLWGLVRLKYGNRFRYLPAWRQLLDISRCVDISRYLDCESRETHVNTLQECSRRSPWPGRAAGEGYIKHSMMLQTIYTYSKRERPSRSWREYLQYLHVANIRGYKGICLFTATYHCSAQLLSLPRQHNYEERHQRVSTHT